MSLVLQVAAAVTVMVGAAWGLGKLGAVLWRGFRKLGWFLDAALGEPAQGSMPARPGMLDRLTAIENRLGIVEGIEARVVTNEGRIGNLEASFQAILTELERLRDHVNPTGPAADSDPAPVARDR